jgi:hypothetical protein
VQHNSSLDRALRAFCSALFSPSVPTVRFALINPVCPRPIHAMNPLFLRGIFFSKNPLIRSGYCISLLQHIVVIYTTSEEDNDMIPQAKNATRAKHRVVAPADKRTQVRLTVDSKFTKSHFNQLFAVLKIRNKNALAEPIIMNFKTKTAQTQLLAFYNGPWLDIPFQSIDTSFVFPLTYEIADELERVGGEILGGVNKSKTFRVMVAYFAAVHKLKSPTQSTFA